MKKKNRNIIGLISLCIAIIVLLFGNNLIERYGQNKPVEVIDIIGDWKEEEANKIVLSLMKEYENNNGFDVGCLEEDCEKINRIINHFWVDLGGKKSYITIAYTKTKEEMGGCHACPAPLSIFEFEKVEDGYRLNTTYFNRETLGKYGEPPENISVIPIGYNKFGIEIIDEFDWSGGDGEMSENYFIYSPIGDDFKEILQFEKKSYILEGYPNFESENWNSKISIIKEGTGYYNFNVKFTGVSKGNKVDIEKRFRFNGVEYKEI